MSEVSASVHPDVTTKQNVKKKKRRNRKKTNGNESESQGKHSTTTEAKKKNKKKRRSKNTKDSSAVKSHELQLPHVKVTLRNIVNVKELEGSRTGGVVQLLREIVQDRNKMVLDGGDVSGCIETSMESLSRIPIVFEESSIQKILIRDKKQREEKNEKESNEEGSDDPTQEQSPKEEEPTDQLMNNVTDTEVQVLPSMIDTTEVHKNCIQARLLYLIPPHKSRRRGIIPGHCYLVLSPPIPKFYQDKMQLKNVNSRTTVSDITSEMNTMKIDNQDTSQLQNETHAQSSSEVDTLMETAITPADRSKAFAQARIILNQAVDSLSKVCKNDTTKEKLYSGIQVFTSQSQKIWKDNTTKGKKGSRMFTKYENTIEKNEDFLKFLETRKTMEEERMNRPKPQPGGGLLTSTTVESKDTGMSLNENGQPVSAIVLHLRQKHAAKALAKAKSQTEKKRSKNTTKGDRATTVTKKKNRNKKKKRKEKSEAFAVLVD